MKNMTERRLQPAWKKICWVAIPILFVVFQTACASKKHVKTEVARIDQEMGKIETSVEANETRIKEHDAIIAQHGQQIAQLSKESQEALDRAQSAEKLAQGKLLYEVTLTDEQVKFAFNKADISASGKEVLDN